MVMVGPVTPFRFFAMLVILVMAHACSPVGSGPADENAVVRDIWLTLLQLPPGSETHFPEPVLITDEQANWFCDQYGIGNIAILADSAAARAAVPLPGLKPVPHGKWSFHPAMVAIEVQIRSATQFSDPSDAVLVADLELLHEDETKWPVRERTNLDGFVTTISVPGAYRVLWPLSEQSHLLGMVPDTFERNPGQPEAVLYVVVEFEVGPHNTARGDLRDRDFPVEDVFGSGGD